MLNFNSATIHAISQVFHRYAPNDPCLDPVMGEAMALYPEDIWDAMHEYATDGCQDELLGPDAGWSVYAREWASERAFIVDVFQVARALIEAVESVQ